MKLLFPFWFISGHWLFNGNLLRVQNGACFEPHQHFETDNRFPTPTLPPTPSKLLAFFSGTSQLKRILVFLFNKEIQVQLIYLTSLVQYQPEETGAKLIAFSSDLAPQLLRSRKEILLSSCLLQHIPLCTCQ